MWWTDHLCVECNDFEAYLVDFKACPGLTGCALVCPGVLGGRADLLVLINLFAWMIKTN